MGRRHSTFVLCTLALAAALVGGCDAEAALPPSTSASVRPAGTRGDWTRFGFDAARSGVASGETGITAKNARRLVRQRVALPGTADSSPIYLRAARVLGERRDVFVLTTSYGRTVAVDAASGRVLWEYVPPGIADWEGTSQITNASPVADPGRRFVYTVSPDGRIHKLALADGSEVRSQGWPAVITLDPTHEKIAPALNISRGLVLAATGGYVGDAPPYQGHVVAIDSRSGRLVNVFNTLCSDRGGLIVPSSCAESGSAIWARSGVVVEPGTGNLLVATGDGEWNGRDAWGDSVLELSPDAGRLLQSYTPANESALDAGDIDLGSTAPALLPAGGARAAFAVQGGKDGLLRLLDLDRLNGRNGAPDPYTGGELQTIPAPGGRGVLTAPAVWRQGGRTWLFVANGSGTSAYVLRTSPVPRLQVVWQNHRPGTSPVLAGRLLFVYDPSGGGLNVYRPALGELVATLPAGSGHWNSPIVADGRIALPEGNANEHATFGTLDIYRPVTWP